MEQQDPWIGNNQSIKPFKMPTNSLCLKCLGILFMCLGKVLIVAGAVFVRLFRFWAEHADIEKMQEQEQELHKRSTSIEYAADPANTWHDEIVKEIGL